MSERGKTHFPLWDLLIHGNTLTKNYWSLIFKVRLNDKFTQWKFFNTQDFIKRIHTAENLFYGYAANLWHLRHKRKVRCAWSSITRCICYKRDFLVFSGIASTPSVSTEKYSIRSQSNALHFAFFFYLYWPSNVFFE